jgi:hypothetical protein
LLLRVLETIRVHHLGPCLAKSRTNFSPASLLA